MQDLLDVILETPKKRSTGFVGTSLAGAEIGNFDESAGRHVRSSSGELDFRPGKTLYLSVDFASNAGSSNELLIGYYTGAYTSGKGWVIERGASSNILYLTRWDGTGYVALATNVRLGVRQIAITWKASDNTIWVSVDGSTAASVGTLTAPNSDGTCSIGLGSPVGVGNIYADSLKTGAIGAFGLIASELSASDLAAASNSMSGTTPLNRFTLPSQFASPVVDFNTYRDWDGSASSFVTQGSSPITFAVTGAISKTDTSEVYYATSSGMYHDNALNVSETYAVRHNAFARIRFTTSLRRLAIHQTSTIYSSYTGSFASVGVFNGGAYASLSTSTVANASQVIDSTMPAGSNKTIDLVEGSQAYVAGDVLGTFMSGIRLPTDAVITAPTAPTDRVLVVGDSIINGFTTSNAQSDGPIGVLRGVTDYKVTMLGWGSATSYEFTQSATRAAWVSSMAAMLNGTNSNTLIWQVQTNDYGLSSQSSANYATNLGAFLDDLKVAVPNLQVKLFGAITRIAPAAETANGFGNTLDNYRSAASGLTSGRSWVKYINNKYTVSDANHHSDGIHVLTAGAAQIAYSYFGVLDFSVTSDVSNLGLFLRGDLGITLNGSDASQWDDQSGNGRNYVQGTAALQPAYTASNINGQPTLDTTSGGGEKMGVAFKIAGAHSIFLNFKLPSTPSSSTFHLLSVLADATTAAGSGAGSLVLAANYPGYTNLAVGMGAQVSGAVVGANVTWDTNPHTLQIDYDGSGVSSTSAYKIYLDGVEQTVVSTGSFISSFYGSMAAIGATSGGNYPANCNYAEKLVTTSVISANQRAALRSYSANRYAINPT